MNWTKEQQDAIYKKDSNILRGNISSDLILQELNPSEEVLKKAQDLYEWFTDQHFLE